MALVRMRCVLGAVLLVGCNKGPGVFVIQGLDAGGAASDAGMVAEEPPDPMTMDQPVAISASGRHTCVLTLGGAALCWKALGATPVSPATIVRPTSGKWTALHLSRSLGCGLTGSGKVQCWDLNFPRVLQVVTSVRGGPFSATQLSSGERAGAIDANGDAYAFNRVGDEGAALVALTAGLIPVAPAPLVELSVSSSYSCGITEAQQVECSGVTHDKPLSNLECRALYACGLSNGGLFCWGYTPFEEDPVDRPSEFVIDQRTAQSVDEKISLVTFAASESHLCGLDGLGRTFCRGSDDYGKLGIEGSLIGSNSPEKGHEVILVPVPGEAGAHAVATGADHSCVLTDADEVYCWGFGYGYGGEHTHVPTRVVLPALGSL